MKIPNFDFNFSYFLFSYNVETTKLLKTNISRSKLPNFEIPKIDPNKTSNDFGFTKKSFNIKFQETGVKKLSKNNIEKQIQKVMESVKEESSPIEKLVKGPTTDYISQTKSYNAFMSEYLKDSPYSKNSEELTDSAGNSARVFEYGQEVINHKERKQYMRAVMMNKIMGAPNNAIDPNKAQEFMYWTLVSKFNQMMSFMVYDSIMMLQ